MSRGVGACCELVNVLLGLGGTKRCGACVGLFVCDCLSRAAGLRLCGPCLREVVRVWDCVCVGPSVSEGCRVSVRACLREAAVVGAGDQRGVGVRPHAVLCGTSGAVFCVRDRGLAGGGGPRGARDRTAAEARTGRSGVPAQRGEWWRRREGGDPGTRIPPPLRPPLQRRSLEILALAGPAVLEAPGLEDSTGPGRHLRTGGSGGRGLEIREQPRSARRGLPAEAGGGPETVEDQAETKKRGAGASRRDRTSGSPAAEGRALLAPVPGRRRSGPRAPGTRNYAPRAGPRCGASGAGEGEGCA
ncbi:collagen alpha chain-like [Bos javanicus]|uniref:collagen alpha chain-like n=1 Tax=Bos javanicus TaxID=9906 RepID=UPI002AA711A0|nr:collagen alpha chain-like [Bos javanicus]